ncbi:MAG TPA: cytochrome d ubiquinol oxidase subunit II [Thermoleophilaceae bacterium]|nr:cytochrome d ubiquinol oxidase subunit II [Thermoleophilaceae bacterium]
MVDLMAALLVVALSAYAVLGGADFGAGFWDLTAGGAERGARLRGLVKRSMGPVWEANHVWLIVVLVVMWTCFPHAFGPLMETLYVPLFLAAVGIIFRGAAFALRGEAATIAEARALGATFALSSVLTPFCLGCVIGAVASGQVPAHGDASRPFASWTGTTALWIGALAVAVGAYIAAVFLAADAVRARLPDLVVAFRRRALAAAAVAGALALSGLAVINSDAPALYDGLTSGAALAAVIASAVVGVATLWLIWTSRFELARYTSAVAVGATVVGWVLAQRPDFLPGQVSLAQAAAGNATLVATLVVLVVALIVIVPSLTLLFRLSMEERLRERFHPIGTTDDRGAA